jgi:hypothetical protein
MSSLIICINYSILYHYKSTTLKGLGLGPTPWWENAEKKSKIPTPEGPALGLLPPEGD